MATMTNPGRKIVASKLLISMLMGNHGSKSGKPLVLWIVAPVMFCLLTSAGLQAADSKAEPASIAERVTRLERRVSSGTLLQMLTQIGQLQSEISQLRGNVEEIRFEISGIKKRQRDLYLDLDRRLLQLEGGGTDEQFESGGSRSPSDNKSETNPPPASSLNSPDGSVGERDAYQKAYETLRNGEYDSAINQFRSFLSGFPKSDYADNAQYWLAESYYVTRNFQAAQKGFADIVKNSPGSAKAPDALLKTGFIEYEKERWAEARATLNQVVQQYPSSNAASLAKKRLAQMSGEKR